VQQQLELTDSVPSICREIQGIGLWMGLLAFVLHDGFATLLASDLQLDCGRVHQGLTKLNFNATSQVSASDGNERPT